MTIEDEAQYDRDLAECRELSEKHKRTEEEVTSAGAATVVAAGGTTIVAAIVTAAVSAGTVVLTAVAWPFIAGAAVVGGIVWGVRARSQTKKERAILIDNCLAGRGYRPLRRDVRQSTTVLSPRELPINEIPGPVVEPEGSTPGPDATQTATEPEQSAPSVGPTQTATEPE